MVYTSFVSHVSHLDFRHVYYLLTFKPATRLFFPLLAVFLCSALSVSLFLHFAHRFALAAHVLLFIVLVPHSHRSFRPFMFRLWFYSSCHFCRCCWCCCCRLLANALNDTKDSPITCVNACQYKLIHIYEY